MHYLRTDLILASTSPRRKEILSYLQVPFRVIPPTFIEHSDGKLSAKEEVLSFAEGKAMSVASGLTRSIVIGSDTLIDCDGKKIGKPKDKIEARQTLRVLQGRSHQIWTAVFLIDTSDQTVERVVERVDITLFKMSDLEIDTYIATGEPLDKAGAYAVQGKGSRFIRRLRGERFAAIGLPLHGIIDFLRSRQFFLEFQGGIRGVF